MKLTIDLTDTQYAGLTWVTSQSNAALPEDAKPESPEQYAQRIFSGVCDDCGNYGIGVGCSWWWWQQGYLLFRRYILVSAVGVINALVNWVSRVALVFGRSTAISGHFDAIGGELPGWAARCE